MGMFLRFGSVLVRVQPVYRQAGIRVVEMIFITRQDIIVNIQGVTSFAYFLIIFTTLFFASSG